jgi:ketosteroid isomerase-like protein
MTVGEACAGEVVAEWKRRLRAGDWDHMGEVVDLEGYTEICLGLTGWTTGYEVATANFLKNMVQPWSDQTMTEVDTIESGDTVVSRFHVEATHTGEFLGVAPTGRHIESDSVNIVKVRDGKVVGQRAQPDLWGIHRQIA